MEAGVGKRGQFPPLNSLVCSLVHMDGYNFKKSQLYGSNFTFFLKDVQNIHSICDIIIIIIIIIIGKTKRKSN